METFISLIEAFLLYIKAVYKAKRAVLGAPHHLPDNRLCFRVCQIFTYKRAEETAARAQAPVLKGSLSFPAPFYDKCR